MPRDLACEGWVVHRRRSPIEHEFRYPVWMLFADVDRLEHMPPRWLSTRRRLAPLSVRPDDYPRSAPARAGIRDAVNAQLRARHLPPADRVFLLTQPRSWGWLFNPVSFYFCYRGDDLVHVVAEITNTPWDEVHRYVLEATGTGDDGLVVQFPKQFHVSPFMPMDLDYRWRLRASGDRIEVAMSLLRDGQETFFAGLYLQGAPVTARRLRRGALAYPLQNLRTLGRIYWQAFRLWRKGAPFHAHPGKLREVHST